MSRAAWVMLLAALLPGMGQWWNRQPLRGLTFVFFMLVLAWVSWRATTPAHSFVGRHAGGFFVYALSVLDAYRVARLRDALRAAADRGARSG